MIIYCSLSYRSNGTASTIEHSLATLCNHAVEFEQFMLLRIQTVIPAESLLFDRVLLMSGFGFLFYQFGYLTDLGLSRAPERRFRLFKLRLCL